MDLRHKHHFDRLTADDNQGGQLTLGSVGSDKPGKDIPVVGDEAHLHLVPCGHEVDRCLWLAAHVPEEEEKEEEEEE